MTRQIAVTAGLIAVMLIALNIQGASAREAEKPGIMDTAKEAVNISIRNFLPVEPIARAKRPATVAVIIENAGNEDLMVQASLILPRGVELASGTVRQSVQILSKDELELSWKIMASDAGQYKLGLLVKVNDQQVGKANYRMDFLEPVEITSPAYIPEPKPVKTQVLIGAHHCPLWEADKPEMWNNLLKHPERTPALGFYAQENPEVSDWETKWASEHGVNFFIYCWYRTSQGEPVKTMFSSAINEALFNSKFEDDMKFTIMWENQRPGYSGISDENDLTENLLPYWIDNYFTRSSYLKIDNKPVLFIYRPEFLINDLGSEEKVVHAFELMRQACIDAGFDGIYLMGEYRGLDPNHLKLMKRIGLDYTFAYCWHVMDNPTPQEAIETQMRYINETQKLNILPQVVTVSQAWSGWADEGSIWKIPPKDFENLLTQAKDFIAELPENELGSKMLLLDNWNEWGEGHYIAPYREYGFGYLDAVRKVFSDGTEPHVDLIPEDIGFGPYDTAYKTNIKASEEQRLQTIKRVLKEGAPSDDLVGWWAFDEGKDTNITLDYSGNRLGGVLVKAKRTRGIDGNALVCDGGSVIVENSSKLSITDALTISCWAKTDVAKQPNVWMVNRIFSGGTNSGYRLGLLDGKPCFEVPQTDWSHHLSGNVDMPLGEWVHLAGTFDGQMMRVYMNGVECGTMERPGPINPNSFHLCLGNFERDHTAFFNGLLDEVKLYNRALSAEELRLEYEKLAPL